MKPDLRIKNTIECRRMQEFIFLEHDIARDHSFIMINRAICDIICCQQIQVDNKNKNGLRFISMRNISIEDESETSKLMNMLQGRFMSKPYFI